MNDVGKWSPTRWTGLCSSTRLTSFAHPGRRNAFPRPIDLCNNGAMKRYFPILLATLAAASAADEIDFNRDIRPILSDKCFQCHGPDEKVVGDGLRLDQRESALEFGAIVPGKPGESELVSRIESDDLDTRMPPAESEKSLTPGEIKKLKQWIREGGKFAQHWAFVKPRLPDLPTVQNTKWVNNPIDRFILAKLAKHDLQPAPRADKVTLIRRLALDLTGLPPTPEQVSKFLADTSPNAYETLVDEFLSSPHYGERMAINWLDYARYADSNGFQSDGSRDMWAWRDWVIQAYNQNMPFDQFTVEQIAGDMLPQATPQQIVATGFNRNHRLNGEGGFIPQEWFVETVIDRVETTGLTWLGLTFNCCRCHDHKFDPISQKEFYQLFAYFNSCDETGVLGNGGKNGVNTPPILRIPTVEQKIQMSKLIAQQRQTEAEKKQLEKNLLAYLADWEKQLNSGELRPASWNFVAPNSVISQQGAKLVKQSDESWLATGKSPRQDTYEIVFDGTVTKFSGFLLEVFPHSSMPNQSLGRGSNGNFVLTSIEAEIHRGSKIEPINFRRIQADFSQENWPARSVKTSANANNSKGWAIAGFDPKNRVPRRIMFVADRSYSLDAKPVSAATATSSSDRSQRTRTPKKAKPDAIKTRLVIRLLQKSQFAAHTIGRFKISLGSREPDSLSLSDAALPTDIATILKSDRSKRTAAQNQRLVTYFRNHVDNPLRAVSQKLVNIEQAMANLESSFGSTMVMKEGKVRQAFVLTRGEYDKPGEKVSRGLPAILPPLPKNEPNNRLGLARWLVNRENPLTARVWVNRQWEMFFGTGIVKTSENFGSQAEYPSHPELLDWLAIQFMNGRDLPRIRGQKAQPWDMKAFQKLILMSATYQQSSHVSTAQFEQDPENRFCGRASRFRLSGELIRDQALAVGGLLVPKIGGPSVRPYMPPGVWSETTRYGNLRQYKADQGAGLYRRTLYTIWKRTAAPPTMLMFDAPNREACTIKRSKTNTPLQALSLLNEVTFVEAARGLANRMAAEPQRSSEESIAAGFQIAVSREPTTKELAILVDGFAADLQHFRKHPGEAEALIKVGNFPNRANVDASTLAAYILTANIILNLDEFVTRE